MLAVAPRTEVEQILSWMDQALTCARSQDREKSDRLLSAVRDEVLFEIRLADKRREAKQSPADGNPNGR